jgi:uncharacterized damage-inducible protein DinB
MQPLLVRQLRFARAELQRCLHGLEPQEARRRFGPMNCISWILGHLASQENFYWVRLAQGIKVAPDLVQLVGTGRPASTPPLAEMQRAWQDITTTADLYLDSLRESDLATNLAWKGEPWPENVGTLLLRTTAHYWFHIGEAHAIRQLLGHEDLPQFVGKMGGAGFP